jgi:hypothetical protein
VASVSLLLVEDLLLASILPHDLCLCLFFTFFFSEGCPNRPVLLLDFSDCLEPVEVVVVALVEAVEAAGGASKREFEMQ